MTVPIPECLGITEEDVREALKLIVALRLAALKGGYPRHRGAQEVHGDNRLRAGTLLRG